MSKLLMQRVTWRVMALIGFESVLILSAVLLGTYLRLGTRPFQQGAADLAQAIDSLKEAEVWVVGLDQAGSVIEAGSKDCGTPVATGTLTDFDVDNPDNTFTAVCSPTQSDKGYGTFTMATDGKWTYTLDNANCAVQALNVCDTLKDTFTVTTVDGTPQLVTITITGTNDAAVISGDKTGSVKEAGSKECGTPVATGSARRASRSPPA